jgi:hypothetical protein
LVPARRHVHPLAARPIARRLLARATGGQLTSVTSIVARNRDLATSRHSRGGCQPPDRTVPRRSRVRSTSPRVFQGNARPRFDRKEDGMSTWAGLDWPARVTQPPPRASLPDLYRRQALPEAFRIPTCVVGSKSARSAPVEHGRSVGQWHQSGDSVWSWWFLLSRDWMRKRVLTSSRVTLRMTWVPHVKTRIAQLPATRVSSCTCGSWQAVSRAAWRPGDCGRCRTGISLGLVQRGIVEGCYWLPDNSSCAATPA